MSEPIYESQSVSMEEAKIAVSNSWFCKELHAQENTFESNRQLATNIRTLNDIGGFSNAIRRGNKTDDATLLRIAASNATRAHVYAQPALQSIGGRSGLCGVAAKIKSII